MSENIFRGWAET